MKTKKEITNQLNQTIDILHRLEQRRSEDVFPNASDGPIGYAHGWIDALNWLYGDPKLVDVIILLF